MAITLKTDKQGLSVIDRARVDKNWTALALSWCEKANVSLSTLKRFRERKAIQKDAFIAICQAVGIDNWQQVVAGAHSDVSILMRRYRQSKRVIAEEVLSNLKSLDARLEFVAQTFSNDPVEAQRQIEHLTMPGNSEQATCAGRNYHPLDCNQQSHPSGVDNLGTAPIKDRQKEPREKEYREKDHRAAATPSACHRYPIKIEANVSIIQILMEI
ncbi:MAG: hypothetical protein ACFB16_24155 [Phormidesmis sp.]